LVQYLSFLLQDFRLRHERYREREDGMSPQQMDRLDTHLLGEMFEACRQEERVAAALVPDQSVKQALRGQARMDHRAREHAADKFAGVGGR
jgi:hypothetical protein